MEDKRIKVLVQQRDHFTKYYERCPELCWPMLLSIKKRLDFLTNKLYKVEIQR